MSKLNHTYTCTHSESHTHQSQPTKQQRYPWGDKVVLQDRPIRSGLQSLLSAYSYGFSLFGRQQLQLGSSIWSSYCWYFPCPPLIRSVTFSHGFYSLCLKTSLYYRCRHNAFVEPQRCKAALYIRPISILYINQTFSIFSHNFLTHVCVCFRFFFSLHLIYFSTSWQARLTKALRITSCY